MRRLEMATPPDYGQAAYSGWTRAHWVEAFQRLWVPLTLSATPLCARQLIPGPRSHHGQAADELEGFTRSFIMAAPWLAGAGTDGFDLDGVYYDVAGFYKKGILAGTDPAGAEYWGDPVDYAQHLVEMASLAWGLWQSRDRLWNRFDEAEQLQVATYLYACTGVAYHPNNWLLFNVVTNAVLKRLGMPYRQEQIDANLGFCDGMYVGDGWYQDGDVPRIDYYNAWAFHYYYLMWVVLDGPSKPDIAARHIGRAGLFLRSLTHFMAADGAMPCFGRSEIYRFGFIAPVAMMAMLDAVDDRLFMGELRTFSDMGLKWFLSRPVLTAAGHLSLGYVGPCADMLEHYSCGGSPYWAAKAFNLLALAPLHPFWMVPETPLPSQRETGGTAIPAAGFTLAADHAGNTILLNHHARHDKAEYNDKYTKFAYASAFPYQARKLYGNVDCDAILQFSRDGSIWRQRWEMTTLASGSLGGASRYVLYEADPEGYATTVSLVLGDLIIHVHSIHATKRLTLREGGFAAGSDMACPLAVSFPPVQELGLGPAEASWADAHTGDARLSLIRSLGGWNRAVAAEMFAQDRVGANVRYTFSSVPRLEAAAEPGIPLLLASLHIARVGPDTALQTAATVTDALLNPVSGELLVRFSNGSSALLRTPESAMATTAFSGRTLAPGVVVAYNPAAGDLRTLTLRQSFRNELQCF